MSVSNENVKETYNGNGLTIYWPITFEYSAPEHIAVYLTDDDGVTGDKLESDYTVDEENERVIYPDPMNEELILPEGWKITLKRETPLIQNYQPSTQSFNPADIEPALDKTMMAIAEIKEETGRTIKANITEADTNYTLPSPAQGMVVGWDLTDGTRLVNYTNPGAAAAEAEAFAAEAKALVEGAGSTIEQIQSDLDTVESKVETLETDIEPLGVVKEYYGSTLPPRHLWVDGKTIGDAQSGATARANSDVYNLFAVLWDSVDNTNSQIKIYDSLGVLTEKGESADADFAAHKAISLPDKRGRVGIGLDSMGGTSADVVTDANADVVGGVGGEEKHTQTIDELVPHNHNIGHRGVLDVGGTNVAADIALDPTWPTTTTGGSQPFNIMQPWVAANWIMRY